MTPDGALCASAAPFYARYRVPYPDDLIADLVAHYHLDGNGDLLDLGCGPGTLTLPLAPYFERVVAIDPSDEMIAEAQRSNAANVAWAVGRAETVTASTRRFRLITCGSSFHWMDGDLVLATARDHLLAPGGGIALAGTGGGCARSEATEDWHHVVAATVRRYLGARPSTDRRPAEPRERFEAALPRNGWMVELHRTYERTMQWDIDGVIGSLWSTSFANRVRFGSDVDAFEQELRTELIALHPDGSFIDTATFGLVCGRPP